MDIYSVLTIMLVTAGCSIFLGHAAGYMRGRKAGYKSGVRETRALWKMRLNSIYGKDGREKFVGGATYDVNNLYPTQYKVGE